MKKMGEDYKKYAKKRAKSSPCQKNCQNAFLFGGGICGIGQMLLELYGNYLPKKDTATAVSITLIFCAALLTGAGVYDKLAKHGGAGTLVPITGFANAVASSAIDSKGEGLILGVGAKIFTVAGPVIVYGTAASVVYGVIYWAIKTVTGA